MLSQAASLGYSGIASMFPFRRSGWHCGALRSAQTNKHCAFFLFALGLIVVLLLLLLLLLLPLILLILLG